MDKLGIIPHIKHKASLPVSHGKPITISNNHALKSFRPAHHRTFDLSGLGCQAE